MLLQGVGLAEHSKYGMDSLTEAQLSNMAGNACLAFYSTSLLPGFVSNLGCLHLQYSTK